MKGFPRRGSDILSAVAPLPAPVASMKGFPRRGSDRVDAVEGAAEQPASMKGFPRRGSDSGLEKSLLVR